ncbi:MAG TPA: 3-hydroxyacyl-CoA dehydrogenase [Chryseolinea sp.]|nr:3-hydroxyacyl-CoA dehydrogenase [Chryseolinea sp.]
MNIRNISICGSGVLGTQIAFQTAFSGFDVIVYDVKQELIEKAKMKFKHLGELYKMDLKSSDNDIAEAIARISYSTDLADASKNADVVIEAIPEKIEVKKSFYALLGEVAPPKTIFCTNSSTLLPSMFAQETRRPGRFLALHFANQIWKNNTAEIMGHSGTDPEVFDTIVKFAKNIGMIALPLFKEHPGYILNSLQIPLLLAGMNLYSSGVADPHTIDKTWMIASKSPMGPFATLDLIGFETVYNIAMNAAEAGDEQMRIGATLLKNEYIDKGKLGISTGEGFYRYPNPEYERPEFVKS